MNTRKIAYQILSDVLAEGTYLNIALKDRLDKELPNTDKRFISALCYTTMENLIRIDYVIKYFTQGKRIHRVVKNALRIGVCQLMFFENVPASAAVNESVKLLDDTNKRQMKGFVNAVLRKVADEVGGIEYPSRKKDAAEYLSVLYSYPKWLCEKYIRDYGADFTEEMLSYKKTEAYTCIRVNTLKVSVDDFEAKLKAEGVEYRRAKYVPVAFYIKNIGTIEDLSWYRSGEIAVQSESSMLCIYALGIHPGGKVLDVCAAPGGKSAFAATFHPYRIVALDLHEHRVEIMRKTFERLGVRAETFAQDASIPVPEYDGAFDRVLVDAPCSALGLLYRKPDIKYAKSAEDLSEIIRTQSAILENACRYVAPGGRLVYSTCTINREENERRVVRFLKEHTEFTPVNLVNELPQGIIYRVKDNTLQLFPHIDGIDGFFMAALEKKA